MMNVNNVPSFAYRMDWWIVNMVDGEAWFYDAHHTEAAARAAVEHMGYGTVLYAGNG